MSVAPMIQCPKCAGEMRRIERSGVVVDRCNNCGGVFLDRGELEHLMQAENAFIARSNPRYYDDDDDDDDRRSRGFNQDYDRGREGQQYQGKKKKKKRGFLEDLLDFG